MEVSSDLPQLFTLLREVKEKVEATNKHIDGLNGRVIDGSISTGKGISLLEVKFHLLLSYLSDLALVMLVKLEGNQLCGHLAVDRLVEARTVLEKIRPIDHKLKYQIDKLLKSASTAASGATTDPLRFRPNPANLVSELPDEDDGERKSDQATNPGIYVPPRLAAVPYTEAEGAAGRKRRREERQKEMSISRSLLVELQDEYRTGPEEVREEVPGRSRRQRDEDEERREYEEKAFVRLPEKKRKRTHLQQSGLAELDRISSFDDRPRSGQKLSKKKKFVKFAGKKKKRKGRR